MRQSINDLRWPPKPYRIDRRVTPDGSKPFETEDDAAAWDRKRARHLRHFAVPANIQPQALALAKRLEGKDAPASRASARYMRDRRIRMVGAVWQLIAEADQEGDVRGITVTPANWSMPPEELLDWNPDRAMRAMRGRVDRAEAAEAEAHGNGKAKWKAKAEAEVDGWLWAMIDGVFNQDSGMFDMHLHGVAAGGMIAVCDRLRKQKTLQSPRPDHQRDTSQRVVVNQQPFRDLAGGLSYRAKSFWMEQTFYDDDNGKRRRGDQVALSIAEQAYALLWQDRWGLAAIDLLMKLEVAGGRLRRVPKKM